VTIFARASISDCSSRRARARATKASLIDSSSLAFYLFSG
jgi:hypothetical protein